MIWGNVRLQANSGLSILRFLQSVLADKRLFRQIITEMEDSSREWSIKEHVKLDFQTHQRWCCDSLNDLSCCFQEIVHSKCNILSSFSPSCPSKPVCWYFCLLKHRRNFLKNIYAALYIYSWLCFIKIKIKECHKSSPYYYALNSSEK